MRRRCCGSEWAQRSKKLIAKVVYDAATQGPHAEYILEPIAEIRACEEEEAVERSAF